MRPDRFQERALNCSNCAAETRPGQKFCSNCGARLAAACPSCAAPVTSDQRFCATCGTALHAGEPLVGTEPWATTGTGALAGTAALAGGTPPMAGTATLAGAGAAATGAQAERRLVSVLFADLVGFTSLAEGRDAEDLRELLGRYFETGREVIGRYGGTVEKFIGDAVMAVWGAPRAHEDDAERAVRAALELVDAVRRLGEQSEIHLEARAGVLTGEAAVTLDAQGQGLVAGDMVNTASRLQSVAEPGTVLVGRQTRDAASDAISFEELGQQQLKGKSLPIPAWRAVRVVAGVGGAGRHAGLEPPFEGRDEQLRLLKDLFHATARERKARLVSVIGQAGTGKSRLLREFEKYTDGLAEDVYWHIGRSPAYGEGISFWALGEMVRKRAGLAERDDDATTRERIAATLEAYVANEADRRWIESRLLQLLGAGEGRQGEREEVFAAWRLFFEHIAARGTVVLAFEDLENADPGLLDFIEYVVEWSRNQPIFVLALTRPELLERRTNWGAGQRSYAVIGLEPLTDEAMRQALAGLVPGLPEPAVRAILARAEGVPLYAVETVRMLLNQGRLAENQGVYQPVGDLTQLEIPGTLQALIAARLDALERDDRAVLQDAAVLGQSFTLAALAGISGRSPEELEPKLRSLIRREVIELDVDPRSPERGQHAFVQGLVREVAYSTLSRKDRRTRHLAAARYFESLGDEELAGALAGHYLDAWRATAEGPEKEAIAAQARVALRAAADRATDLHAHDQALAHLEYLLAVTSEPAERATALERAALAAEAAGKFDVSEAYGREALELHRAAGDEAGMARAATTAARSLLMATDFESGISLLEQTLAEIAENDDEPAFIELIALLARLRSLSNDEPQALALAERTLVAAERLDLVEVVAATVQTKAISLSYLKRSREATILLRGALALVESHNLLVLELRTRLNLSQIGMIDEPRAAFGVARIGLERARRLGLRHWEMLLLGNALMAALRIGEWEWAEQTGREVLGEMELNTISDEAFGYLSAIRAVRGDGGAELSRAITAFEGFLAGSHDPQYPEMVASLRAWLALAGAGSAAATEWIVQHEFVDKTYAASAFTLAGHAALWARDLQAALAVREAARPQWGRGRWSDACRRSLEAGVMALEGRTAEASALFAASHEALRSEGVFADLALCLMDALATLGIDHPAGRAAEEEARGILQRLKGVAVIEQLDRLAGGAPSLDIEAVALPDSAGKRA